MSTLSKPKYVNRKAIATICAMLVGGEKPPFIYSTETEHWVTNSYIAFAFSKEQFIFNPDMFKVVPALEAVIESAIEKSTELAAIDSYKVLHGKTLAKLIGKNHSVTYVNKGYFDMFSNECSFYIGSPIEPVIVMSPYGELCGIILPVRYKESEGL